MHAGKSDGTGSVQQPGLHPRCGTLCRIDFDAREKEIDVQSRNQKRHTYER